MRPRNRRYAELLEEVNEATRARMRRETLSDLGVVIVLLGIAAAVLSYWGRHGWPY